MQLELLPGLIKYNYTGDVIRKKRFDMCLILRYDESKFVTEEMMNNCISIRPLTLILRFNNHNRDYKIFDENMWILNELQYVIIQNTNSCDNRLFEDLELHDIKSCELTYKLEGKIFEYKIPIHTLKPINEVWRIYNETNS